MQNSLQLPHSFLPEQDPLKYLPQEFAVWEAIATDLPKLFVDGNIRNLIQQLPITPFENLISLPELERAMLILSYLGHAYVWSETKPAHHLPANLAVPWSAIASKLGRPPVLSYASYALHNWRRIDSTGDIALGNIVLLQNFLGGIDEEWFILVHVDIEAKAMRGLQAIPSAIESSKNNDTNALTQHLQTIANAITAMCNTLDRMPEHCDPYIYFNRVRPYIHGWKNHPDFPEGLIYEGVVEFAGKPQQFRGETGAQSTIIPSFDALLGIEHDQTDLLGIYLREMRDYMPPLHRRFLEHIEQESTVREYCQKNPDNKLIEQYNRCIENLTRFRKSHLGYASAYIHRQAQVSAANPNATGTGGTPFMSYLKKHLDEAASHRIV